MTEKNPDGKPEEAGARALAKTILAVIGGIAAVAFGFAVLGLFGWLVWKGVTALNVENFWVQRIIVAFFGVAAGAGGVPIGVMIRREQFEKPDLRRKLEALMIEIEGLRSHLDGGVFVASVPHSEIANALKYLEPKHAVRLLKCASALEEIQKLSVEASDTNDQKIEQLFTQFVKPCSQNIAETLRSLS